MRTAKGAAMRAPGLVHDARLPPTHRLQHLQVPHLENLPHCAATLGVSATLVALLLLLLLPRPSALVCTVTAARSFTTTGRRDHGRLYGWAEGLIRYNVQQICDLHLIEVQIYKHVFMRASMD